MLRAALACSILLLLAGCASPTPTSAPAQSVPDDGVVVTATRVEPLVHPIDLQGMIESRPCRGDGCGFPVYGAGSPGLDWDEPQVDVGDPLALFWRVWVQVESDDAPTQAFARRLATGDGFLLTLYATKPCGIGCVRERQVAELTIGQDPAMDGFNGTEVYPQGGETGLRIRLVPRGMPQTYVGDAGGYPFRLHGDIAGYRAVAAPVVVA